MELCSYPTVTMKIAAYGKNIKCVIFDIQDGQVVLSVRVPIGSRRDFMMY